MADVCVDDVDFKVTNGQLQLNPHTLRSATSNFVHTLDGVNGVMEEITELPALVVPVSGVWVVAWDIHGNANNTAAVPPNNVATNVYGALAKNDVIIVGTETAVITNSQGIPSTNQPSLQLHATGSGTDIVNLAAGDQLSIYAARASDPGTTTEVLSGPTGRTRIRAWRLAS